MTLADRLPEADVGPADWIVESVHGFAEDVGSIVPPVFEAYARILHPATVRAPDGTKRPLRWAEIAASNGRIIHPEVQLPHLVGFWHPYHREPAPWDHEPDEGSMPPGVAAALVHALTNHTSATDDCWFGVWDGWGGIRPAWRSRPTFSLPSRPFYLLGGSIMEATTPVEPPPFRQTANLWWPDDRAWCVATEIDFAWTYVGGSAACIADIVAHPDLEALHASISDGVTFDADTVNPAPPGAPHDG